jgi:hypothetical protein
MSKDKEPKQKPEEGKKEERKMRGWVGRKAGVEETATSADDNLEKALKKKKK